MPEEVVAALLVALETVLGEAFGDSLEEGDEECDLLAEPSFPDNSTIHKFIKLFSAGVYWQFSLIGIYAKDNENKKLIKMKSKKLIAHYYLAKHLPLMRNENENCMQWHEIHKF